VVDAAVTNGSALRWQYSGDGDRLSGEGGELHLVRGDIAMDVDNRSHIPRQQTLTGQIAGQHGRIQFTALPAPNRGRATLCLQGAHARGIVTLRSGFEQASSTARVFSSHGTKINASLVVTASHTTIHRWVIRYVPEFEKRWNRFARPVNTSWRVDETYIKVRGKWNFLTWHFGIYVGKIRSGSSFR
jgi:hypothetical protein